MLAEVEDGQQSLQLLEEQPSLAGIAMAQYTQVEVVAVVS